MLSKEVLAKIAESNIIVGSVIRCFNRHTNPPKEKRIVIVGKTRDGSFIGTVLINSNINFNIVNNQELLELQYPVKGSENDYLDYDSFIDCSKLFLFGYEEIKSHLTSKPLDVLGIVSKDDLKNIYTLIQSSPNIAPIQLKEIGVV